MLNNATVSGNSAGTFGGGIYNGRGRLTLNNATVSGNSATLSGGGIYYLYDGTVASVLAVNNSIVAGNSATSNANIFGSPFNQSGSLTSGDPLLAPLGNYGGRTQTMPPLPGSPAIDTANPGLSTDQRGFTRPKDGDRSGVAQYDIGAVEVGPTYVVNTAVDQDDGVAANGISLRDAISDFSPIPDSQENRVFFDPAVFNGEPADVITLTNGSIPFGRTLCIDASAITGGVTISGANASRLFGIPYGQTVTMDSLIITDGYNDAGGAIYNGGILTLNHTILSNNFATSFGGGIYSDGSLTLNNCTLSGNSAVSFGGGIINSGDLKLNNTTLSGNSSFAAGGGIASDGTVTMNNCTLAGNSATTSGGGIANGAGGLLLLNNSIVAQNDAPTGPDVDNAALGIMLSPTGVNLLSDLANSDLSAGASVLVGDPLLAPLGNYGGPTKTMPPLPGSPAIDATPNGPATDQRGVGRPQGADYDIGAVEFLSAVVTTAADESNVDPGTGLSLREAIDNPLVGSVTFDSDVFDGERADTIILINGQLTIMRPLTIDASPIPGGVAVSGNNVSRVFNIASGQRIVVDSLAIISGRSDYGGGIFNSGILTLRHSSLSGNTATNSGGGVYTDGKLTLMNSTVYGNTAANSGGILSIGALSLTNSTVSGNAAANWGGGILTLGSSLVNNCTVSGNSSSFGGGIFNFGGTILLHNAIVAGNTAPTGPDVDNTTQAGTIPPPTGVNLIGNLADSTISAGGSVLVGDPLLAPLGNYGGPTKTMPPVFGSPVIDAATNGPATDQRGLARPQGGNYDIGAVEMAFLMVSNNANSGPGSLRQVSYNAENYSWIWFAPGLSGQTITLAAPLILFKSVSIDASGLPGGLTISGNNANRVMLVFNSLAVVLDSLTITGGGGGGDGGGISNPDSSSLTLNNCTLSGNFATGAGGIYNEGMLTLNNSTVSGNSATTVGGGIYNGGTFGTLVLNNTTVSGNAAATDGGGIYNASNLQLNNTTVSSNSAFNGGGVFELDGDLKMINCTVSGNVADQGGGIYKKNGSTELIHCTVGGNTAQSETGGGVAADGYDPTIVRNSIIAENIGSDVHLLDKFANGFVSSDHNLIGNGNALDAFNQPGDLTNSVASLSPLANYGGPTLTMPPLTGSHAIDAATVVPGITTDQRGFPRTSGLAPDIGAAEFQVSVIIATNAPVLTGLTVLGNGTFQFGFANLTGASFTVFASTNVAWPLNTWSNLGPALETPASSGQFQFTDPDVTNYTKRFYRVISP